MTSPALFVLSIALVCSTCGTSLDQGADHDIKVNMKTLQHDVIINNRWTNQISNKFHNHKQNLISKSNQVNIFNEDDIHVNKLNIDKMDIKRMNREMRYFDENSIEIKRKKRQTDEPCDSFKYDEVTHTITHPHSRYSANNFYAKNITCVTVISAPHENSLIELTFVDVFRIENHPQCDYDYLEVRDGLYGYANRIGKVCGQAFPRQMATSGPYAWLKFHSDDTIEYEGFKINVKFTSGNSYKIPEACLNMKFTDVHSGVIDSGKIDPACVSGTTNQALDVLWTIQTPKDTKIYLNFTSYQLEQPNECEVNVIQVFGAIMELDAKLVQYCGSIANSVTTTDNTMGNIMHVRFYAAKSAKEKSHFNATFNAFRSLDPAGDDECDKISEFDCEDSTCIHESLSCDGIAHCRLKADEESCNKSGAKATMYELHIIVIIIIFSLILSGMSFVFVFKCVRKLYKDHKLIKEHLRQSCEDRLDSRGLTLDPKRLQMDSEPRASLERDNHTNFKKQRSFSKHKQSSIESDYIEETHIDLDEEPWRREVDSIPIEAEDIRIEPNGRTRRSDLSRKEESIRSRTKESEESKVRREIRDVSVGAPDTKESSCQTRESLFQTDPPPSSDGSGTNSRGFSTFGYSGATIAKPSPPVSTNTSEITIELFKPKPPQETKPQKKMDRRPISTETTRSAPDVIIVSKPIR